MPQNTGLHFSSSSIDFASDTAMETALFTIFNALDSGFVLFNWDGSQTVVTIINDGPIGFVFNNHGQFTGFVFDILPSLP